MIAESIGATRPAEVEVAMPQVWIRRGIESDVAESAGPDGEAVTCEIWRWREVSFIDPAVTQAYAEAHADELWAAHEQDGMSDYERLAARLDEQDEALAELGDLIAGGE